MKAHKLVTRILYATTAAWFIYRLVAVVHRVLVHGTSDSANGTDDNIDYSGSILNAIESTRKPKSQRGTV